MNIVMKCLFVSILLLVSLFCSAQRIIKNGSFEAWQNNPLNGALDPDNWKTNKTVDTFDLGPVVVLRSADAISGQYSTKLIPFRMPYYTTSWTLTNTIVFEDTTSFLPTKVKGFYKLIVDSFVKSAHIVVSVRNDTVNGIPGANVAGGTFYFSPSTQWTPFELDLLVVGPHPPQFISCWIELEANDTSVSPKGALYIDSITVEFTKTSINTLDKNSILVYPNPATADFTVRVEEQGILRLRNLLGEIVLEQSISKGLHQYSTHDFPPGYYLLNFKSPGVDHNAQLLISR